MSQNPDSYWRTRVAGRCGGRTFDAPGGGYAFSQVLTEERQLAAANVKGWSQTALLCLSIADPTWKMPERAMAATQLFYEKCPDATRYTDNAGIRTGNGTSLGDTHEEIVDHLRRRYRKLRVGLTPDWVQYSPGAIKRALSEYIPTLLLQQDTHLLFWNPGYPVIKSAMNARGAKVIDLPMENHSGQWHFVYNGVSFPNAVAYINVPHNPTGRAFSRADWENLLCFARESNTVLVVDEAYTDIRYNPDTISVLEVPRWEECCIVLQSVSKGWSATGLRFGWMIGHPTIIKALRKITDVKDSGMFGPSIAAGLTCLRFPEWAEETRQRYENLHRRLHTCLQSAGFQALMPDAGLCQFTPAPKSANGQVFKDIVDCVQWFRRVLRVSLMHYLVGNDWYLRWAVTIKPVPECNLPDEQAVITEVSRRLQNVKFSF